MECGVVPCNGVFGVATARGAQLVQSGDAVTGFEVFDVRADGVDCASDVVALVDGCGGPVWELRVRADEMGWSGGLDGEVEKGAYLPVFLVNACYGDFDEELMGLRCGDWRVDEFGTGAGVDYDFFHVDNYGSIVSR